MDLNGYEIEYIEGADIRRLAKKAGVSYRKMRTYLQSKEVIRTKTEANYLKDPSSWRTYNANYNFFDSIDTEEKAYWLGFITADGHVNNRELRIQLASKDREHLEKFLTSLESTHPIHDYDDSSLVVIKSRELSQSLQRCGLNNQKSYTAKPHILPRALCSHYWRGIFDGDGHITDNCVTLVGTKNICNGFKTFLQKNDINTNAAVLPIKDTSCYKFATTGKKITKSIHSVLYDNSTVSLDRKQGVMQPWI